MDDVVVVDGDCLGMDGGNGDIDSSSLLPFIIYSYSS